MPNKLKILCLHGYRQNATEFKSKTGSLRKILKEVAEFHFLSAPHKIPDSEIHEGEREDQRGWWFSQPNSFSSRDQTDMDTGLQESIKAVEKFNEENGPFDGVLGFSQGAALTGILCALKERNEIRFDFKFAIIFSGFKSLCSLHQKYYDRKISINSLHVIGETDMIITSDRCYDLANVFVNPSIITHPGGHLVPGRTALKEKYLEFFNAQQTV